AASTSSRACRDRPRPRRGRLAAARARPRPPGRGVARSSGPPRSPRARRRRRARARDAPLAGPEALPPSPLPGRSRTRAERARPRQHDLPATLRRWRTGAGSPARLPRAARPRAPWRTVADAPTARGRSAAPRAGHAPLWSDLAVLARMWDLSYTERRDRLALPFSVDEARPLVDPALPQDAAVALGRGLHGRLLAQRLRSVS